MTAFKGLRHSDRGGSRVPRVLSLSSEYPNPADPSLGLFVRSRLQELSNSADVRVLAPVALINYSSPSKKWLQPGVVPRSRRDLRIEVLHPRWIYPPGGTPANILCLFLALLPGVLRLKREFAFDVIDAHFGYPQGVVAALLAWATRTPFMVTLRGNEPIFAENRIRRYCLTWALRRASRVISVSSKLSEFAVSVGVHPTRARTIRNGVNGSVFSPRDRTACRQKHAIATGSKLILCAGALVEGKGHQYVVRAVKRMAERGLDVHLIIAGTATVAGANFEPTLRRLVSELHLERRVRFAGWVAPHELAELMSAADVFCLPSHAEGWPNVVHEALSCGTPVIATSVGGIPDLIPSAEYGLLTPVRDQAALENALAEAMAKRWDRDAISRWGLGRTWDQVAREVLQEIEQVLACVE